jgi:flagellar biosynthetic protein FliR
MTAPQAVSIVEALQPAHWPTLVVVGGRFIGLMLAAPLWSMAGVPKAVRGALVLLYTLAVLPVVTETRLPPDFPGFVGPLATELMLGVAIGLTAAVFMAGVGLAGEVVSIQMGLNLGPALAGVQEAPVGGIGELKSMLALVCYVTLGGHLVLLQGIARSLTVIPPGGAIDVVQGGRAAMTLAGTLFATGAQVAAPIMVALLLANLGLAILARAMPQLTSMAVAFPITISLGLLALGAALPLLGRFLVDWVARLPGTVAGTIGSFVPVGR